MDISKKREELVELLYEAIANDELSISYSSPRIKSVKCFYVKKSKEKPKFTAPVMETAKDDVEQAAYPPPHEEFEMPSFDFINDIKEEPKQEPEEPVDSGNLTYKELKQKQKEERRQSKQFDKSRKDLHKRGFDTGILRSLDNPEDIYELSDDEIAQIEIAGYINKDGYYSFVYPPDIGEAQEETISGKRLLLILACAAIGVLIVWRIVSNFMNIF